MSIIKTFSFLLIYFLLTHNVSAQNNQSWTDYRGLKINGHSDAMNVPTIWNDSTNIAWRTKVSGLGWSSPIILDGQIWITSAINEGLELYALSYSLKTGKQEHRILVLKKDSVQQQHPLNSFASPTVAIETDRVYTHFGAYGTACLNSKTGKIIWKREDIYCDHEVGPGSSPIIYNDLLIFHMDGVDQQYLIALDKKSGKTVWKKDRGLDFSALRFDEKKAFYTPIISKIDGKDQLVSPGPQAVMGYDPSNGKQIWIVRYKGFSGSARPLINNKTLFINTGFGNSSVLAIRLGGKGDLTKTNLLWENRKSMQARSSSLFIDGLLYMINTGGQAKCINPVNGEIIWTARVGRHTSSSPFYACGNIYTFDEEGLCTVFKPGKTFKKLSENQINSGSMASPAPIDGAIIVRTQSELIRIGSH